MKHISMTVGIYDTLATLTRHRDGGVTLDVPYVRWDDNTGTLAFEPRCFGSDSVEGKMLSHDIFTDDPLMDLGEYLLNGVNGMTCADIDAENKAYYAQLDCDMAALS